MSTPEDYAEEREKMRRKSDGELLQIRATTGNPYTKDLVNEVLEDRRYARNVLPDRRRAWAALVISILAFIVSIIAYFKPEFRSWVLHLWESLP